MNAEVHELNEHAASALDNSSDPMYNDEFDSDTRLNRHVETIETKSWGQVLVQECYSLSHDSYTTAT